MVLDVAVEKLALGEAGSHLVAELLGNLEIAIAPAADELDFQLPFLRQVVKRTNHAGRHDRLTPPAAFCTALLASAIHSRGFSASLALLVLRHGSRMFGFLFRIFDLIAPLPGSWGLPIRHAMLPHSCLFPMRSRPQ